MKKTRLGLAGLALLAIIGCEETTPPTVDMKTEQERVELKQGSRYKIERVDVFKDDLAYGGKRGIYEITDEETGITYIGVSGIGITERGSHTDSEGDSVPDER